MKMAIYIDLPYGTPTVLITSHQLNGKLQHCMAHGGRFAIYLHSLDVGTNSAVEKKLLYFSSLSSDF